MKNVTITADSAGAVIRPSKGNPEFGFIRLEQNATAIDDEGWVRKSIKSALIKGSIEDLKSLGYTKGMTLDGQIVVNESMDAPNSDNLEQGQKVAGESGVVCSVEGQPIYRTARYTTDLEAQDVLIKHDNVDAIKEAQAELTANEEAAKLD